VGEGKEDGKKVPDVVEKYFLKSTSLAPPLPVRISTRYLQVDQGAGSGKICSVLRVQKHP